MARITRKSYKRKKVVLGLCMFASVALISTGFAAWILSADATKDNTGSVTVGKVNDGSVEFGEVIWSEDSFRFDAKETDDEGRMKWDPKFPEEKEVLSVTVSGYVINANYLDCIKVKLDVSSDVLEAADKEGTYKYIELPKCAYEDVKIGDDSDGTISNYTITSTDKSEENDLYPSLKVGDVICKFSYEVKLNWGKAFENQNPGQFFDEIDSETGKYKYTQDEVEQIMADLKEKLETNAEYTITLTAVAKV